MRIAKIASGFVLLAAGIAMLALPGPGWLTIAAGLAILAGEFVWARQLLNTLKDTAAKVGGKAGGRSIHGAETEAHRTSDH